MYYALVEVNEEPVRRLWLCRCSAPIDVGYEVAALGQGDGLEYRGVVVAYRYILDEDDKEAQFARLCYGGEDYVPNDIVAIFHRQDVTYA